MVDSMSGFIAALSSKDSVPGGGGASALMGAVGAALCSMVANLTVGKKKYAEYQADMEALLVRAASASERLLELIEKDAEAFAPLAEAYGIPRDTEGRDGILENALTGACAVPLDILRTVMEVVDLTEKAAEKGSRLVISDAAVAAAACRGALTGAAMNIFINTKMMRNRRYAAELNESASALVSDGCTRCDRICTRIMSELKGEA